MYIAVPQVNLNGHKKYVLVFKSELIIKKKNFPVSDLVSNKLVGK